MSESFARIFWIPAASLVAVEIYVRQYQERGAWATAPMFLIPLVLSLAIASAGLVKCVVEFRAGSVRMRDIVFTLVAASPLLWLIVRRHIV